MIKNTLLLLIFFSIFTSVSCNSKTPSSQESTSKASAKATPTPAPSLKPADAAAASKAYHITGNIDDASQEGDVCDSSVPFKVPGTLKFEFTPSSASKGTYTYSGPFNATGSGPYEIFDNGKMLVSGTGCIMGKCADYSHDWKATPIDAKTCVTK
jgi:hypothetical protein